MTDIEYAEQIITKLIDSRSRYLELHEEFSQTYPNWTLNKDARSNLIAKPINLLLVPIVGLKSFQDTTAHINYWSGRISKDLNTPHIVLVCNEDEQDPQSSSFATRMSENLLFRHLPQGDVGRYLGVSRLKICLYL